jgi:serine phosphatase RsbU (regulator of sigma subunit)
MSVDSFYHPVHSIGGDFTLVDSQDSEHISLLVCDVSGHGIGSALVAFILFGLCTSAREILQLSRLIKVFEVYENEEQALAV